MLYVDTPTQNEIAALNAHRADASVSIYVPTTPLTQDIAASRIEFGNLVKQAIVQLKEVGFDHRRLALLEAEFEMLELDDEFWRFQANSLAVFATPDRIATFRLANKLKAQVQVSDRFHLKPLLRAATFPFEAYVLALAENSVRLIEVFSDMPAVEIKVPGLPEDAASHAGKASINGRSASGRIQGSEGQRVRHLQYCKAIDSALRPVLSGRDIPLIIAAVDPLASLYPIINSYPNTLPQGIKESPDRMTNGDLAKLAIPILDEAYAAKIVELQSLFEMRSNQGRTATDLTDVARAASFGVVDTLFVDFDEVMPGKIDDAGVVTLAESESATSYGVTDEIASRVLAAGGRVVGVRRPSIPGQGSFAAILRYPM